MFHRTKVPRPFHSGERKFQEARGPGSERAKERVAIFSLSQCGMGFPFLYLSLPSLPAPFPSLSLKVGRLKSS